MTGDLVHKAGGYLERLCLGAPHRRTGSPGNRLATQFVAETMAAFGLETECPEFDCLDWTHGPARLTTGGEAFEVFISPYSLGGRMRAPLAAAASDDEVQAVEATGRILLLRGETAREQLMPKHFPFYNPDRHQQIYRRLEAMAPVAVVAATARNPELAGAVYPFPLIEDGDFDIPAVYMTEEEGARLAAHAGQEVTLEVEARRFPSWGCNVLGRTRQAHGGQGPKVVICAHVDTKEGTPGALDNAGGVVVLLLLAELLAGYGRRPGVELLAINGEECYAAPGELLYLDQNAGGMEEIVLAANIDGAGFRQGPTAYSLYGCPEDLAAAIRTAFAAQEGLAEGEPWYQSDHTMFVQKGRPALAITSQDLDSLLAGIAHSDHDRPEVVDPARLVRIALALGDLVVELGRP